ncbi:MAG: DUF502 domain-containing protein [Chloroflexi bacterium]|nr:DUF502 domain-containing protein [Chloroflexota bacterium]
MAAIPMLILRGVRKHLSQTIGTGILLLVPVVITYLVLRLVFTSIDGVLAPWVAQVLGRTPIPYIQGLGLVAMVLLIYIAGLVGRNFLGRQIVRGGQQALLRIPVIKTVYSPAKQLIESFSGTGSTGFKRVVMVEYPRVGAWTIGFLTGTTQDETGATLALVYIPTAPTPNSGWVAILPLEDVYDTDLTVPEATRLVLSGGIVSPSRLRKVKSV